VSDASSARVGPGGAEDGLDQATGDPVRAAVAATAATAVTAGGRALSSRSAAPGAQNLVDAHRRGRTRTRRRARRWRAAGAGLEPGWGRMRCP
jgi:hypothetical protein